MPKKPVTLGHGFSDKTAIAKPKRRRRPRKADLEVAAAAKVLRDAGSRLSETSGFHIAMSEPGKAQMRFNETVSMTTALDILNLLQKDREASRSR